MVAQTKWLLRKLREDEEVILGFGSQVDTTSGWTGSGVGEKESQVTPGFLS